MFRFEFFFEYRPISFCLTVYSAVEIETRTDNLSIDRRNSSCQLSEINISSEIAQSAQCRRGADMSISC